MSMTLEKNQLIQLFKQKKAFLEGHFLLSSGLHSQHYWQSALLLQDPALAEQMGKELAALFPGKIDVVMSPALGALLIGHEVARAKAARFIFSEKNKEGKPVLRRAFELKPGEKVLVVEDVVTTGLSTQEVVSLINQQSATLVGVGCLVARSKLGVDQLKQNKVPIQALIESETQAWLPKDCPLCEKGIPLVKPGSRKQ